MANYNKDPTIVTDHDAQINIITNIGELKHLIACMSESIIHLNIFVAEHVPYTKHKPVIKSQVSLIIRSLYFMSEKSNALLYNKVLLVLVTVLNHGNDLPKM